MIDEFLEDRTPDEAPDEPTPSCDACAAAGGDGAAEYALRVEEDGERILIRSGAAVPAWQALCARHYAQLPAGAREAYLRIDERAVF